MESRSEEKKWEKKREKNGRSKSGEQWCGAEVRSKGGGINEEQKAEVGSRSGAKKMGSGMGLNIHPNHDYNLKGSIIALFV